MNRTYPTPGQAAEYVATMLATGWSADTLVTLPGWIHPEFVAIAQAMADKDDMNDAQRAQAVLQLVFLLGVAAERNGWACDLEAAG